MSIVEEDSATLERLGVTHERIANRLSLLMERSFPPRIWPEPRWGSSLSRLRVQARSWSSVNDTPAARTPTRTSPGPGRRSSFEWAQGVRLASVVIGRGRRARVSET